MHETDSPSPNIKLRVNNLSKVFTYSTDRQLLVLDKIELYLNANEFVCLVGASGCGKSTLLKIIAGLEQPSAGEILLEGERISEPGADRGMVFQNYTLFPWRSVADNIGFGLELKGLSKLDRDRKSVV